MKKYKCSLPGLQEFSTALITYRLKHFSSRLLAAFLLTCWLYSRAVNSDTNVTTNLCICVDAQTQNILIAIEKELFLLKALTFLGHWNFRMYFSKHAIAKQPVPELP